MLTHPDNDHWREWREAVKRTGYNESLARAARFLLELESLSPAAFESFTANLYRDHAGQATNRAGFIEVTTSKGAAA